MTCQYKEWNSGKTFIKELNATKHVIIEMRNIMINTYMFLSLRLVECNYIKAPANGGKKSNTLKHAPIQLYQIDVQTYACNTTENKM